MIDVPVIALVCQWVRVVHEVVPLHFDIDAHLFHAVVLERLEAEVVMESVDCWRGVRGPSSILPIFEVIVVENVGTGSLLHVGLWLPLDDEVLIVAWRRRGRRQSRSRRVLVHHTGALELQWLLSPHVLRFWRMSTHRGALDSSNLEVTSRALPGLLLVANILASPPLIVCACDPGLLLVLHQ